MIPSWFLFATLCGICYALEGVWIKKLKDFKPEFLAWCAATLTIPFFWAALWLQGWPKVTPKFYLPFIMCLAGNAAGLTCYFRAFSYGDLSLVFPLLALTPAWMLLTAKSITGQFPAGLGLAGVLMSTLGCYALGLDGGGLLSPFKNLWRNPGGRWALIASVIWSVSSNFDKRAIAASSATFHPASHAIVLSLILYAAFGRRCREDFKRLATFDGFWRIMVLAVLVSALTLSQYMSVARTQAAYVVAVKRGGMVLGVLMGWLILKEPFGGRRFVLSLVVLAGLLLLLRV